MSDPVPLEEAEQCEVVRYLEARHCKFTSIPNSTFTKSWSQKRKNTATGLRAGFPDLVVIANGTFFCIEMKRRKGSTTSVEQKAWHEALRDANIPVYICKGFDEAREVIDNYLVPDRA